ncbi:MAG: YhcH/YjgK/YiaL family protein [Ignavibacteriaceae bacterium]
MIFDSLLNFSKYNALHPHFEDVSNFIKGNIFSLPNGTYKVNDKGTYATVSEYESKEMSSCFIEHHQKNIDVQIVLKGREKFGVCNISECIKLDFDTEKDFGKLEGKVSLLDLTGSNFIIVFPQDGHMPKVCFGSKLEPVKKLVIKVPVVV